MDDVFGAEPAEAPKSLSGDEAKDVEKRKAGIPQRFVRRIARPFGRRGLAGWLWRGLLLFVAFLLIYYPLGMKLMHEIDDDLDFAVSSSGEGSSRAVAISAALIDREVNQIGWRANDPFFLPSSLLDNTPNYQQGIISALARFAFELTDQIGRTRGSSQADVDLQEASGLLQYSGTKWVFDLSTSIAPTASSEAQYRKAMRSLLSFNARLANGDAVFERRADNLLATLDRIAADLGSSSAALEHRLEVGYALFDRQADDVFYGVKGRLYAYYLLLRELRQDFDNVIVERELSPAWSKMLSSMAQAAALQPWVVINGSPDSQFFPSHLGAQGFFLLRARTQLRAITNILLK